MNNFDANSSSTNRSSTSSSSAEISNTKAWRAVADWYHAYFTGILLGTITRRSKDDAVTLVYEIFSRQRQEKFLPGLRKLGLEHLPDAVAAAQYHYLSNHIGGVPVQYMYEHNRKAWIRYNAPRWIWSGTALCAIPPEVSVAMLRGWHAQNGVSLGNPRLGFVCTKQAVDGDSGLEGYYLEHDHELAPAERLRFARDEDAPDFDPAQAPGLPTADWPQDRLAKAKRNYAMEYLRTAMPTARALWGSQEATALLHLMGKQIGMQFYHETRDTLGLAADTSAQGLGQFMMILGKAQGDPIEMTTSPDGLCIRQQGLKLLDGITDPDRALARAWTGLLEGAAAAHNHRLKVRTQLHENAGVTMFEWLLTPPGR